MTRSLDPATFNPGFSRRGGRVFCEGIPLAAMAKRTGTPAYIYSKAGIEGAFLGLDGALTRALGKTPHSICYAVKANSNLSVLQLLANQGSYFDIVSGGELERLRRAGIPSRRAVFSGVGKTREEISEALRAGVLIFNVESPAELDLLDREAARLRKRAPASIRVNPDVEAGAHPHIATGRRHHKFGVDWPQARRMYLAHRNSKWIAWQGISAHVGSQVLSLTPYRLALARLVEYVSDLGRNGVALSFLDIGGGLGVRYTTERPPTYASYAHALASQTRGLGCHLLIEPGRSIVAAAGVLLMRVLYTKETRGKLFVVADAAMNDFMRPALYSAVHPITPVDMRAGSKSRKVAIVGPVCETGDEFHDAWPLGEVEAGDLLALWGAGAYGASMASNYNSRTRATEVLVDGRKFRVIRKRETRADMMRGE
ncbi:MAG TPA: diaminopimelate decarboxylase [Candidatus Acidoferrum sp.]|nr:diaminopimelate decarboxylase [Candidatus Acidoferrum sp.]